MGLRNLIIKLLHITTDKDFEELSDRIKLDMFITEFSNLLKKHLNHLSLDQLIMSVDLFMDTLKKNKDDKKKRR